MLGVYVCMPSAPSTPPLFPLHLLFFPFLVFPRSLIFSFLICPLTVCLPHRLFFLSSLPLILPSLARHRGCNSAQQLLSWHVLHCLLTVLFLLDFIKTPSAVSSGMVEEVVEEEMEQESNGRKVIDLAAEWKENGWTHVESTGCHSGLLSEGHRWYMR